MAAYWACLGLFGLAAFAADFRFNLKADLRRTLWALIGAALIVFIGLRHEVGSDWISYLGSYERNIDNSFWDAATTRDPGYHVLVWLSHKLGTGIYGANFVCAAIYTVGLLVFCSRQKSPLLAIVVSIPYLTTVVAMAYTRQSAALGFVLLALTAALDGRRWRSIALVIIATVFHRSAPAILPFIVLAQWHSLHVRAALIGIVVAAAGAIVVLDFHRLYVLYLNSDRASAGALVRALMSALPAALYLVWRRRFKFAPRADRLWFSVSLASVAAPFALLFLSSTLVDRVLLYIMPVQMVVLSALPSSFRPRFPVTLSVIIYSGLVMGLWFATTQYRPWWVPYQNVLWAYEYYDEVRGF